MKFFLAVIGMISCCVISLSAQDNAGSSVSPKLIKCYNNSIILEKDNRLPATIEILIDLIRKIEDNTRLRNNRELASQLLFSFRQDGIVRSRGDLPSKYGIPYSPKEWNAYRNKVLLSQIIPKVVGDLEDDILTDLEQCSLHFLLSKSVESRIRGDESTVCGQLGKYRMRQRRRISAAEQVESFNAQTEMHSSCPVELGVVRTEWGDVFPGSVIAGIASGLNSQSIPIKDTTGKLDSKYAATIAGDLAEAALYQISKTNGKSVNIGAEGNWNSTLEPKWYFVKNNNFLQMTDTEIRGDLDGLYLALSTDNIKKIFQDIKISQILDLYYSPRGVFNSSLRACNRKYLETSFTTSEKLIEQTTLFQRLLDPVATIDSTINPNEYRELAELAVDSFNKYIPGNLNDPICPKENTIFVRVVSDLTIFLDVDFEFEQIHPMLSNFMKNIDVNRYETKYTIMDAKMCQTLINSSTSILDFHQKINRTNFDKFPKGTDFGLVLETIENISRSKMNNASFNGGYSSVYLIMTQKVPNDNQKSYAITKVEEIKNKYPDTRILVLGVGQKSDYRDYVINSDADVFIMPNSNIRNNIEAEAALKTIINEIVKRLKEIPRSIINQACGSEMKSDEKSTINLVQYVEPSTQNIYRISPNYFYNHGDNAKLKVRAEGGSLTVCLSRIMNNSNTPNKSIECKNINSDEYSHEIEGLCEDGVDNCEPLFISLTGESSYNRCIDDGCRFPDNIRFTISLEDVACANDAREIMNHSNQLSTFVIFFISLFIIL